MTTTSRTGVRLTGLSLVRQTLAGLRVLLVLTMLLGLVYPLAVTALAQLVLPWQANGSLVRADGSHATSLDSAGGTVIGSALVGQAFEGDGWFHPRPSMAGDGYDTLASGGSNLGPLSEDLVATIEDRRAAAVAAGAPGDAVPADALTASASGLDPHISPANASLQVARVATARGVAEEDLRRLVAEHTSGRDLAVLGEPRVDVLGLNIAVSMMAP